MKRSGPPKRRKPLAPGGPLARGKPLARGNGPARTAMPKRGKPIRQRSEKAKAGDEARREAVAEVKARDRGCVIRELDPTHRCLGPLVGHELQKRSATGSITDRANIVSVCSVGNSTLIEGWPDWSHALGLVVRKGESVEMAWQRMADARAGRVDLTGIRCPVQHRNGSISSRLG